MPVHLTAAAMDMRLPPDEKLVLVALSDEVGCEDEVIADLRRVARKASCKNGSLARLLGKLERRGVVEELERHGQTVRYRFCLPGAR